MGFVEGGLIRRREVIKKRGCLMIEQWEKSKAAAEKYVKRVCGQRGVKGVEKVDMPMVWDVPKATIKNPEMYVVVDQGR